jgi:3-oxoacyl-[acyl-carrier-protein] synthase-1
LNDLPGGRLKLPLYLGLPELRPGFTEQDARTVLSGVERLVDVPVEVSEVRGFTQGHAAGLVALALATEQIRQGTLEACLVGGVDSYFQPEAMEWLEANRQLVGVDTRSAFIPGEGAGVCVLMAERLSRRLRLDAQAGVLSVSVGVETKRIKTSDVCLGEGLTATVQGALDGLPPPAQLIDDIICDINGERYRGEEWGFVCLRLPQYFKAPTAYTSPASSWGDTGAASGTLFAMLACQAAARGYATGPRTMLWAGSEGGQRAAAVLEGRSMPAGGGAYA